MTLTLARQPNALARDPFRPPFPRQRENESARLYAIRAECRMRSFCAALLDADIALLPALSDDESLRRERQLRASGALLRAAATDVERSLTREEWALLFRVAATEYAKREREVVDDLADRLADRALSVSPVEAKRCAWCSGPVPSGATFGVFCSASCQNDELENGVGVGLHSETELGYMIVPRAKVAR